MLDLALSVAQGRSLLGFNISKAKVLYCNFEIQQDFIQDKIKAIEKAKEITSQPGDMDIWNLRGQAESYSLIIPMILERIKEKDYGLIILDPLYKIYGDTDENSAGDMAALMNELERLAVKSRAAVVFGAHYSKGNQANKESIDRVSGSGVYGRDPDSILNFTRHEEAGAFVVEADLRNLPPLQPFVVKWEYPLMTRDCGLNPQKLKTAICKKPVFTVDDLTKVLSTESMTTRKLRESVLKDTGMSRSMFYELLQELKETAGVTFDEEKQLWTYSNPHGATLT
jgi:hypothetical protein